MGLPRGSGPTPKALPDSAASTRKEQLDQGEEGALRRYAMRNATRLVLQLLETGVLPGLDRALTELKADRSDRF